MTAASGLRLAATPSGLVDETPDVVVSGCRPGQMVTLRARMRDDAERRWESEAVFEADGTGRIDAAARRPVAGTYDTADSRGLFWSMRLVEGDGGGIWKSASPLEIELTASMTSLPASPPAASVHITRYFAAPGVSRRDIRDDGLVATLFRPAGTAPRPAVIAVPGSGGGLAEANAALLASHGFVGLALAYFRAEHLPAQLVEIPLEYFETAIRWLGGHDAVRGRPVGIMGASRGGELALLLGATFPAVRAVVGNVPSGVVHGGLPAGARPKAVKRPPAWTYHGKALPFVSSREPEETGDPATPLALAPRFLRTLEDRAAVAAAEIPVERIQGPVLLISGQDDQMWPSPALAKIAMDRLARHHHPHPYRHLSYPGAGHLIGPPGIPATVTSAAHPLDGRVMAYGGSARDNAAAAADSWPKILAFFRDALDS
jgi:dienelactone hydrolase